MNQPELVTTAPSPVLPQADPDCWVDAHGDCLYRFALLRVRKEEVAEDLVQETLLVAVRTHEKFGGRSSERSWLVGILKNKICDHFRKLGRETNFTDLEFFGDAHSDRFDGENYWIHERGPSEWKPEGEEAMKRAEFWQALEAGLARLPERIAAVFTMREIDDIPSKEICVTLKISEANLWVMLHRARMALREHLETSFFQGQGVARL
ncbi:RNA polymerase, sigma-24 subunit, ECF subfamily [Chthoniobacter flavus Ellin428]|uniref:RNA polymerase, sigma-24 subunit, ECF subfamily n=1 Tax=Chthoniobacter flavus Ellin428 TaxID=497964 RepID=B4DAP9_9BACT|nr:sigma-70 family RNA polymerase sigma factor [Chthoniobacter flavus]EDY16459.1 RNA polymerase, sigma-24 subunit, ECF subfamily [Chthoniobacter flavus Ellin428]TCO92730.1 RNA polymerase sigma-70 factor (ECF subfamily) [Chthoniobacter flavus]